MSELRGRKLSLAGFAVCCAAAMSPGELAAQVTFTDVTAAAGFAPGLAGWSHAWADYDRDGFVDVILLPHMQVFASGAIPRLWRNKRDGTFSDVTAQAGLGAVSHDPHGVVWGDVDNDGWVDLYIAKGGLKTEPVEYNELWRNNRNGTFTNVAETAGVTGIDHRSRGAYAVDFDGDGDLDLFSTTFFRGPLDHGNLLYRNDGNLVFTEVAAEAGLARLGAKNRAAAWADYDGDGLPDVLLATPCALFRNQGGGAFAEVTAQAGIGASPSCSSAAWGDYDGDGDLDLYVNMTDAQQGILYRNDGGGMFTDVTLASGAVNVPLSRATGVTWGDYDNDGDLDLYVVNAINASEPNRLFRNNGDGTFTDVTTEAGVGAQVTGLGADASFVDYDNDGDLDLFVSNGEGNTLVGEHVLYRNNGTGNGWLKVTLLGRRGQSNRGAVGAKVWLSTGGRTQYREYIGQHYMAQDQIPLHFGVGSATVADQLVIQWPSGVVSTFTNVRMNRTVRVTEPLAP